MTLLEGLICIVTGATRGIGKGIALQLGKAKATVYVTGRTLKKKTDSNAVAGSLEETVEEINNLGGKGIAVVCDHGDDGAVEALFARVSQENDGRLDILVNSAYSAVGSIVDSVGVKFWESETSMWDTVNQVGLRGNYITTVLAARLMVPRNKGLIVNVTSLGGLTYIFNVPYGVGKAGLDRMTVDCAIELRKTGVTCLALCPGAVLTEEITKVLSDDQRKGVEGTRALFKDGESPQFSGRTLVALASDPALLSRYSGRVLFTADLASHYGLTDIDGRSIISPRSLRAIVLHLTKGSWLASWIPAWIKIPTSLLVLAGQKY